MRLHSLPASLSLVLMLGLASCGGGGGASGQDSDSTTMGGSVDPLADLVLEPAAAAGLRSYDDGKNTIILTFLAVKSGTEDRSILHYALDSVPSTFTSARLSIPLENIDPGPPLGTFYVYAFGGFGDVRASEWDLGMFVHAFTDVGGGIQVLTLDVTTQLKAFKDASLPYLSFNLRGGPGTDRYNFGAVGLTPPALIVTP